MMRTFWAKHQSYEITSPLVGSTRLVSSLLPAQAACWPTGSSTATPRWISETLTFDASIHSRATVSTCETERPKPWACCTRCTGHSDRRKPLEAPGARRCTTSWSQPAPAWEKAPVGSAQLGTPPSPDQAKYEYSYKRQNWFGYSAAEHEATRDGVALFDQTSFSKFEVQGPGAAAAMNRICANDVDVEMGTSVYGAWLNERGGIEADLTVTRTGENHFFVVTAAASQNP